MNSEKEKKLDEIAREVLQLSRNTLLVNLRFLDGALSRLSYFPTEAEGIFTEGTHIIYNPRYILNCYKAEKELPVRDYLHITLHCIFRHMFADANINREYWDLACDIAVESVICELGIKSATSRRNKSQISYLVDLKLKLKKLTAEKIYRFLADNPPSKSKLEWMKEVFSGDDHEIWYMTKEELKAKFGFSDDQGKNSDKGENGRGGIYEDWKEVSQRMEMELEAFSKHTGNASGSLTQNLLEVNREKYDYTAFLKKFAVLGEAMKINDDEFDYIFYTYGMELYKNMPLIEPLEYKEVKRIKDFVIAIDTSGSTSGELVQKFIQKTYNILKTTESFFSKVNINIIQCDSEIREVVKITSEKEFDEYLKTMKIHGLGGTDFRPVFQYVNELLHKKELLNLKGLIYFTDGYGVFPKEKPSYETAFVFVDDECNNYNVPPWAIKLILQSDEI